MQLAGYISSAFIGISLGLIGGGGSILTVPVLVYLFAVSPLLAVSYSLFIVGFTSLVGAYNSYRKGLVNFKTAFLFGSTSIVTVFLTRKFIIPILPDVFFKVGFFSVTHALFVMILFAILMLAASLSMIKTREAKVSVSNEKKPTRLILYGITLGLLTGFLGAGGGFLLIPALIIIMKLPTKEAIGTSLLIIALNSIIGFISDIGLYATDWKFLIIVTAIATAGIFIGSYLNQKVNGEKLKKGFGYFVLTMGICIIIKEVFL